MSSVAVEIGSELEAFAAAFDAFARAAKRARVRVDPDAILTPSQHDLVGPLADGPLGLRELARAAGVSAPTATRMVDGLSERGLVTREPDAGDRRAVRIALTASGRAAVGAHAERRLARRRALYEQLSASERRAAAAVLARLAEAYESLEGSA